MSTPLFPFAFGPMLGVASPVAGDMVRIPLASPDGGARFTIDVSTFDARSIANALFECSDASEAMPTAVVAPDLRDLKVKGSA